jgi:hypothetical protein
LILGNIWVFCSTNKGAHKGDYTKVFNSENYLQCWTNNFLAQLTQLSIIILDNAKYHFALGTHIPKRSKMKKQEAHLFLEKRGICLM